MQEYVTQSVVKVAPTQRSAKENFGMVLPHLWRIFVAVLFIIGLHIIFLYKATQVITNHGYWLIQGYIFVTGLFLLSRFFVVFFYTDSHRKRYTTDKYPSVSFVIAAKNEGASIGRTIETCHASVYPGQVEVIVIDDGSTDSTRPEIVNAQQKLESEGKHVRVITFDTNRGKREAMAEGVLMSNSDLIVFVDSDSFPEKDAIRHIAEHFINDPNIGAVAGNSKVENIDTNMLTKMQAARYAVSFDVFKACEGVFGAVTCCPGCFSAYRRTMVLEVLEEWRNRTFLGTRSTFGDDRSLTNFIVRHWKVAYCRSAIATTIVPEDFSKFMRQQLRWKKSWIREGTMAASFFWRKNIIASLSFYINLIIPIAGPFVVTYALLVPIFYFGHIPAPFLFGVVSLGLLYALYCFWVSRNRYWWYITPFILLYTVVLVWQMPYALFNINDTRWGTR